MKYKREHTMPALLAGLWTLLAMLEVLEVHTVDEFRQIARFAHATAANHPP